MDEDIERLLRRGRREAAFELLLDRYENKVVRLVSSYVRNTGRAEDVTQDVFLKMWQALSSYDGRAGIGTWLYTIARNTALSHLRAESYRHTEPLNQVSEPSVAHEGARRLEIERLLASLPDEQREVVTLFYLQGCSVAEVARMLDYPEGTVKSVLHRARKAMAARMELRR